MFGNLVLRRRARKAVKRDSERISDDITPQMKILNVVVPILQSRPKLKCCKPHNTARHPNEMCRN